MDFWTAKINQLVIIADKPKTFVRSFATRPDQGVMEKIGKVFGLIEIESINQKINDLIDLIIEEIKINFYQKGLDTGQDEFSVNNHFEAALKKTNLAISAFLDSEQINLNLEKVNILIALVHDQDIHFTLVGNMGAILFYNTAPNSYRIIDILDTTQSSSTVPDPLKLFSQIISGRIRPRDVLFIATSNIFDYFSLERIKNILTDQLPEEGASELKQLLAEIKNKESFGGLTIELEKTAAFTRQKVKMEEFNYRQAASKDSIQKLIKTEKETEKLLTPSIFPEIKKYGSSLNTAFKNYLNKVKSGTNTFYQKQKVVIKKPNINLKPIKKPHLPNLQIGAKISGVGKISSSFLKKTFSLIFSKIKKLIDLIISQPLWQRFSLLFKQLGGRSWQKFKRLPKSSQILLILTIILTIWLVQSIVWLQIKNHREQKIEQFNQAIVEAETKKNDAQSSLIYRDESQARQLLIEAQNLLNSLLSDSDAQTEQISLLKAEIDDQLQKLRHFVDITDLVQIVNFQNLDGQAEIASVGAKNRNTIYTQNIRNQSIYKANIDTRVMSAIFSPNANTGDLKLGITINKNEIIFFNDSMSAFILNPNNDTLENITININANADIADVATYNNRLYLLDKSNSQIYRYSKTTSGYGNINNWITEEGIDLADSSALVVDGSVYILKNNGKIIKLQNGRVVDWQAAVIDPVLVAPNRIKTTESSNYLYILDPPTKRIVVLDKEGNLVNQYTSESFNDLKDFFVDEAEKEIYVLAGSSIFGIPAKHLE